MAKRRLDGEGTIFFNTKSRLWEGRVPDPDGGKTHRKRSKQQSVVKQWFDETKAAVHRGEAVQIGKSEMLAEFLERWIDLRKPPNSKPRTYESYRQVIYTHLIPGLGRHTLHQLSRRPELVQKFLNERRKGRSGGTIVNMRSVLRVALADAKRWGLMAHNVATDDYVQVKNVQRREAVPFQPAEARLLLDATLGTRFEHLWVFLLNTGIRLSEALALRWCDVNLDTQPRPWFHVKHTLQPPIQGQAWEFATPKSKKGRRPVGLPDEAQAALRAQKDLQAFERGKLGDAYSDHDLVFAQPSGEPFSLGQAEYDFAKLLKLAKLDPDHTPHDLRHTCVTYLRASGVPDHVIQDLVGHSNLAMVRHYEHTLDEQLVVAAERFETWLAPRLRGTGGPA